MNDTRTSILSRSAGNVRRALVRRWPAVAAASVAAAVPVVAFAAGPTVFNGTSSAPAVIAYGNGNLAIEAVGRVFAHVDSFSAAALQVSNFGGNAALDADAEGTAVEAHSTKGHAVRAISDSIFVAGEALVAQGAVHGAELVGKTGSGLISRGATEGIYTEGKTGIYAFGTQNGVFAKAQDGSGVVAQGNGPTGIGVVGNGTFAGVQASGTDTGVTGSGGTYGASFSSKNVPLRLFPGTTAGAPTADKHRVGEFYVDANGQLFLCTQEGTPGTWKQVVLK